MALTKTLEISVVGTSLALTYSDFSGQKLPTEYYPICGIKSIKGVPVIGHGTRDSQNQRKNSYPFDDMLQVIIEMDKKENSIIFDIQSVTNQAGWTPNLAGLIQATTDINTWAGDCGCCDAVEVALLAIDATLASILNATVAHQDMEILLVRDTGNADLVVQQIREYDETTSTWTTSYQNVSGAVYVPVGPLVYLDPSAVLNLILTQVTNTATNTLNINTKLTPAGRTHNTVVSTGVGAVPAGSLRGSVLNNGNSAGTWNGISIPRGVSIPWGDIFSRDAYGAIAFDATGTTFIIEYTT